MRCFFYLVLLLPLLAVSASAQSTSIRITEFLASNTNGIKDEDNSFQGWVEVWNADQAQIASMVGSKLTNGTTTWNFPDIKIMPDERIIVWASGKNRINVTAPLHLNFTLSTAAGGTLQLKNSANTNLSSFTSIPAQTNNVSYGRDEVDTATSPTLVGFYTNPTPGDRNNYSGSGVAGKVLIDKSSRAFTTAASAIGPLSVTLSLATPDPNAVIRYTITSNQNPNNLPTASSTAYAGPITIGATCILRARVFTPGKLPGETETAGYLLLDSTTLAFSSPMPILVVSNFGASQPPPTGDQMSFVWLWEPAIVDGRSRFTNLPTLASRTVIDRRGSSTIDNPKHNVNLEFRKARDNDDRDVSLIGMADGSDYVLGGPYEYDRSEIHNPFAYNLSRSIGRYAPDVRLVEVFFDVSGSTLNAPGQNTQDYFGIYNLTEKIRRDKDRVNVMKLGTYDNDTVGKTGGFIYKVDRLDSGDGGFSAGGQNMAYYYPKEDEIESPQRLPQLQYLSTYINSFSTSLGNGTFPSFLDVPAAIDHHLINVWTMNVDGLRLSGYWHKQRGGKLVPGPVWDFDRAMESADGRDDNPSTWRSASGDQGTDFFNYTWWTQLFNNADFYQKYIDRWVELRRGAFSEATINSLLDTLNAKMPAESINRDLARWGKSKRSGTFPGSPTTPNYPATQAGEIQRIKEWLQVRANFMNSQWVAPVTLSHPGGTISPGLTVTMSGPAGATIYYTLDGSDPRPSGGGGTVGANVFNYATTPPAAINATTRIRARAYHPSWTAFTGGNNPPLVSKWSGLTEARYSTDVPASAANLVITEFSYHPTNPTAGELLLDPSWEDTDFEYVELKNTAATPIDLAGVHFTDGIGFTFSGSQAITIGAGQFVIIAANPAAFAARYGNVPNLVGPFTGDLSDSGETLILQSAANVDIFNFTYADSWYGSTDGNGKSLVIYNPTAPSAAFSTAANWRASSATGGSPNNDEPNFAPAPNAGPNLTGNLPAIAIAGVLNDDQRPTGNGSLTAAWSKLNGPGSVDFAPVDAAATTASFTLPGVYNLRLSSSDGALSGSDDVAVTMRDTPSAWLMRHPGIGTLNDDPDGDGRTNYYEWALLLDPEQNTATDGSLVQVINDHLTITFQRQKNSTIVTYTVQVTGDVTSWNDPPPGDLTETILADDGVVQTVRVTDNTLMSSQTKRFIRLRIVPVQ